MKNTNKIKMTKLMVAGTIVLGAMTPSIAMADNNENVIPLSENPAIVKTQESTKTEYASKVSAKPVIKASSVTIKKGSKFDPMSGVSATDANGKDITGNVQVIYNDIDTSVSGSYLVRYYVQDGQGNESSLSRKVTVEQGAHETYRISAPDRSVRVNENINLLDGVKVYNSEGQDVTKEVNISHTDVYTDTVGIYTVIYTATKDGSQVAQGVATVQVADAPTINTKNLVLDTSSKKFDPMDYVSANDEMDGDITDQVKVTKNNVDLSKPGNYEVVYEVTNSSGLKATKPMLVKVIGDSVDNGNNNNNNNNENNNNNNNENSGSNSNNENNVAGNTDKDKDKDKDKDNNKDKETSNNDKSEDKNNSDKSKDNTSNKGENDKSTSSTNNSNSNKIGESNSTNNPKTGDAGIFASVTGAVASSFILFNRRKRK